jgi:FixJ family two-component response regulator
VSTITIVEDDGSVILAVSRLLEAAGFHTRCFQSAGALLSDRDAYKADCLVLDVHLPDMTGFELQRRLAAAGSTTPVVVITAHDDAMHRRAAEVMPDVILMDLHMPDSSGIQAAREIKQRADLNGTPIIALSATPPDWILRSALFATVLHKPFLSSQLLEALAIAVRS